MSTYIIQDSVTNKKFTTYFVFAYDSLERPRYRLSYINPFGTYLLSDSAIFLFHDVSRYPDSILTYDGFKTGILEDKKTFIYNPGGSISEIRYYTYDNNEELLSSKEVYSQHTNTGLPKIGEQADGVSVYPNPAKDKIFIQSQNKPIRSYSLFDMKGQMQCSRNLTINDQSIDIAFLKSGLYFLQMELSDGSWISKRMMKLE